MFRAFPLALTIAACSAPPAATNTAIPEPPPPSAPPVAAALGEADKARPAPSLSPRPSSGAVLAEEQGEPGPGGPPITLAALRPDDARLEGELRCGFEREGRLLLLAAADVDPAARAAAVVRNGEVVERLVARAEGGFNALTRGGGFGGKGLTALVTRGAREDTGTEETRHRATLRLNRADGAVRVYRGIWSCGP